MRLLNEGAEASSEVRGPSQSLPHVGKQSWLAWLSEWERAAIILPCQRMTQFDALSRALGLTVQGESVLVVFACLYWALDQYKCVAGIWLVPILEVVNGCVKWLTHRPRPSWEDERVQPHGWSSEYSFPSSHSQLAMALAVFFVLASSHEPAVSITPASIAVPIAILIGLSRVHVGLHYPSDVVFGWLLGGVIAAAYSCALPWLLSEGSLLSWGHRCVMLCVPGVVTAAALIMCFRFARRTLAPIPDLWRKNACRGKYGKRELDPTNVPLGSYSGMVGVLAGLAVGESFMGDIPMPYPDSASHTLVRCVFGNLGLIVVFEGIALLTPKRPLVLYSVLRFVKYAIVPVYILILAPILYRHVGI